MAQTYKIRRVNKGGKTESCSLAVPANIADILPEDCRFTIELTDDGILYKPEDSNHKRIAPPAWISEMSNGTKEEGDA